MKAAVMRVVEALEAAGIQTQVKEFAESTRTAEEAAAAIGCTVGQIVKSLIFLAGETPILAFVSGVNQADTS
ncbi:MAG TPA: YbaK/EbsC family protein, partial [Ktedonobacterales bacterium]